MENQYDIAIAGGGLAGASLACCLAGSDLRVAVLERYPLDNGEQPSYDDRGLALSLASCRILGAIGVWEQLAGEVIPIQHIHISDRGGFGSVVLHASDLDLDAMGHVVVARVLGRALLERISMLENVSWLCPRVVSGMSQTSELVRLELDNAGRQEGLDCRLLVAADGSSSAIREQLSIAAVGRDYGQTAIVANITVSRPHHNTAYERFTRTGPVALLPMSDARFVCVFCVAGDRQDEFMAMDAGSYIRALQDVLGTRPGRITRLGNRRAYPLRLLRAREQVSGRTVLLGNAAHTIHPNGAQGFNLGLRDAAALAELLRREHGDPGSSRLLHDYLEFRKADQDRVIDFTDTLADLFYSDNRLKTGLRNIGMLFLDMITPVKNRFARQAMGLYGRQPGLVRGLDLDRL